MYPAVKAVNLSSILSHVHWTCSKLGPTDEVLTQKLYKTSGNPQRHTHWSSYVKLRNLSNIIRTWYKIKDLELSIIISAPLSILFRGVSHVRKWNNYVFCGYYSLSTNARCENAYNCPHNVSYFNLPYSLSIGKVAWITFIYYVSSQLNISYNYK